MITLNLANAKPQAFKRVLQHTLSVDTTESCELRLGDTSQRHKVSRLPAEPPGMYVLYLCIQDSNSKKSTACHWIKVASPARDHQLNRENEQFHCPRSGLRSWSRETGSTLPSHVPFILHIQAESVTNSGDFFPRRRPFIPSTAIGSVPSLSRHANGVHCRESAGTVSLQGSSSRKGCCLFSRPTSRSFSTSRLNL